MGKRRAGIIRIGWIIMGVGAIAILDAGESKDFRQYLHPRARIEACPENLPVAGALTVEQVLARAVEIFRETGVQRLCICEVRWIGSPVSGYLVDALGDLELKPTHGSMGEEGRYSLFRLGVSDRPQGNGFRFASSAGEEFAIVARGVGPDGKPKWFPPPVLTDVVAARMKGDPQAEMDLKFPLVYFVKYFQDRERFASLGERYAPYSLPE